MQEQTIARVRQQRDELIRLKRQGGGGALRAALNVIIGNVAGDAAGGGAGGAGAGAYPAGGGGGYGGGGGGAAAAAAPPPQQQLLPQRQQQRLEQQQQQQHWGAGTPACGLEDCFDALTPEDHLDLLLRLQAVLEEEEVAAAAALAGEQLEEHEARELAELEYLSSQVCGEEQRADCSSGAGRSMDEPEE
jgi:hypothetical protein